MCEGARRQRQTPRRVQDGAEHRAGLRGGGGQAVVRALREERAKLCQTDQGLSDGEIRRDEVKGAAVTDQ